MPPIEIDSHELHYAAALLITSAQLLIDRDELWEAEALIKSAGLLKHAASNLPGDPRHN